MKKLPVSVQSFSHDSWKKLLDYYEAIAEVEVYLDEELPTLSEVIAVLAEGEDATPSV